MLRSTVGLAAAFLAAAFALTPAPAAAYTPESGIWWNPEEPGSGVVIETQDNLMVVAAYVGDEDGNATWYTATAFLTGNAAFDGSLDLTQGSQCVGCDYEGSPQVTPGAGGSVEIRFDPEDETRATLTWITRDQNNVVREREIDIERFGFYTRRPEDGATPIPVTKMLGEWQWMLDFSNGTTVDQSPYFGEVTVFDDFFFNNTTQRWEYEGCRPDDSLIGGCSTGNNGALAQHSANGHYDAQQDVQVILVDDSDLNWALYVARVGTNDGEGEVTIYRKGTNPGNTAYPARLWRSASRTFVETGVGPSKVGDAPASARRGGLGDALSVNGQLPTQRVPVASKFDREALAPIIKDLEARLEARKR